MTPPNEPPPKPKCLPCRRGRHVGCLWRSRPSCGCDCPWLRADMLANFPSLRRLYLQGGQHMTDTQSVDNDPDYKDEPVVNEPLPEPTDPAQVPPDEGDAGKAEA